MTVLYVKSKWEFGDATIPAFLRCDADDRYNGAEIHIAFTPEPAADIGKAVHDAGLLLIAQMNTWGDTPHEHIEILEALHRLHE